MLDPAFDRLGAFLAVQTAEHGGPTADGVLRLQEAVGLADEDRRTLVGRLPELAEQADPGAVLLGVLIGLLAAP